MTKNDYSAEALKKRGRGCIDERRWEDFDKMVDNNCRSWSGQRYVAGVIDICEIMRDMTLTQFRMELIKGKALYNTMVGTLYNGMLLDDLAVGKEWFEELLAARKGTAEFDCYYTFSSHGIFRLAQNDAYERMYNRNK